jgi:hypothetical protein
LAKEESVVPIARVDGAGDAASADGGTVVVALGGLTHPYQPLDEGTTWEYRTTQSLPPIQAQGPPNLVTTSTERIVSVERGIDRVVARLSDTQKGGGGSSERSVVLTPRGITPEIGEMQWAGGTIKTISTTGVYMPIDLGAARAPQKWSYTQVLTTSNTSAELEVVGKETVRVPAGEYEAVHVQMDTKNGTFVQHDDRWFARGVGLVRSASSGVRGYRVEKELVKFERPSK